MKKLIIVVGIIGFISCSMIGTAHALPLIAATNQVGYSGTVTYTPQGGTAPVVAETSTPRDAYIYFATDYFATDYNIFMSNWSQHSPSNVHNSFFQLWDENADTVTSISGGWNDAYTDFTITISGANAIYTNDSSRAWMPDQGVSARGTWVDYALTLTASGMTAETVDGWIMNATDPTSITGSFSGTFVSEARTYSSGLTTFENTYYVDLELSSALFDKAEFTGDILNAFGAPVPEPTTIFLFGVGLLGLLGLRKRNKK